MNPLPCAGIARWDLSENNRGVVTINSTRSKAVIGFGGGRRFQLDDSLIERGTGLQQGWSAITLTALDRARFPKRWLLTATGYAENTGTGWDSAEKSSVGRAWGQAPSLVALSLVEGVAARISATDQAAWSVGRWMSAVNAARKSPRLETASRSARAGRRFGPNSGSGD